MSATPPPESTGEVSVESFAGVAYAQKWWSHREHDELLRFGRQPSSNGAPDEDDLIREAELVGLLDAAWTGGLLSDFAKRQIFHLMMRRYYAEPSAIWAVAPSRDDD